MLVLDTDHLSVLEWEASPTTQRLLKRLSLTAPDEAATTIINFEEQMRGLDNRISDIRWTAAYPTTLLLPGLSVPRMWMATTARDLTQGDLRYLAQGTTEE